MKQKQPKPVKAWTVGFPDGSFILRTIRGSREYAEACARGEVGDCAVSAPGWSAVEVEIRPVPRRRAQKRKK